ncbi:hypothetical protein COH33_09380 [Neisseria meningitidis]|uniref:Uncharacterized protein n=3 Tax=Neisseria meningitidis TaxID=487 RepID=X5EIY1_NEIME|nr:hypothetical protein NMA510612_1350 [Neisseria meningitidis]CAM08409.1 hypothetical protein NMA1210 [Neisseria meningitidis Z2491]CBA05639.1 hypothetical protein NMO_0910 [Neisseria meningitidis alpha14]CBY90678.1 hypothetical protein NMAA_0797 [Neisseria meningitidis WUE 2594]ARC04977.1 hypothetical protein A6J48_02140 [Neisseria meningitidis]
MRKDRKWTQISAALYGQNKTRSAEAVTRSFKKNPAVNGKSKGAGAGYGGHLRAIQGFRYRAGTLRPTVTAQIKREHLKKQARLEESDRACFATVLSCREISA